MTQILPPEILKKVKLLEISTRKLVNNIFAGEYHTSFKGQGMTFAEFREYVPGDDVRSISWTLTAKAGKPYIKKFDEERELTVILVVDVSASNDFGSGLLLKSEAMLRIAALLAFSAVRNKDQVGLMLFSDRIEHFVPPKKGKGQVQRILRDLLFFQPKGRKTNLDLALKHLYSVLKKRATIFVMSDFLDRNYDSSLKLLGKKHDVVAIVMQDELEKKMPSMGLVEMHDAETMESSLIDTSSALFQKVFQRNQMEMKSQRDKLLRQSMVDRIDIVGSRDIVTPLISFFQRHRR